MAGSVWALFLWGPKSLFFYVYHLETIGTWLAVEGKWPNCIYFSF